MGGGVLDLGMDPHSVPAELKKEGSDWFAVFNPNIGECRVLSLDWCVVDGVKSWCLVLCFGGGLRVPVLAPETVWQFRGTWSLHFELLAGRAEGVSMENGWSNWGYVGACVSTRWIIHLRARFSIYDWLWLAPPTTYLLTSI